MRRALCIVGLAVSLGLVGCANSNSGRSTIFSPVYWWRHGVKLADDFHEFRVDIDRTIFDLDDRPIEEQ